MPQAFANPAQTVSFPAAMFQQIPPMLQVVLAAGGVSFVIAFCMTAIVKRVAPRIGFVDKPGGRKIHHKPKPLGGGVAIFLAIALPLSGALLYANYGPPRGDQDPLKPYIGGVQEKTVEAAAILVALLLTHLMGLWDDRKALGPYVKLVVQLGIAVGLVGAFKDLRVLTAAGPTVSLVITVLWITAITNAFNFLDNMDGLSAGVAAVCTAAFLVTALMINQLFVSAMLAMLLGALIGFLCFNFPPASIFMGDSGSLVVGLMLGLLTVRTTFLPAQTPWAEGWYAVFAPVIVLALPLYDLVVVSILRLARGKSPFVGDTNHFSHRLVGRGMSRRTAVLCLYLVSAATAVAAIILPHVQSSFAAILIFAQTILILLVVLLLEQHPLPKHRKEEPAHAAAPATIDESAASAPGPEVAGN